MARPILRLATRFTRRTRATAWAIAFACMVLVGAMSLADGLANGVGSVANRIGSGPAVYIQGNELLASAIDFAALANVPGDFVAMRAHAAGLEINRLTLSVFLVALESYHGGIGTIAFPAGPRNVSLDVGLRVQIEAESGMPVATSGNVSLFGLHLTDLPIVAPPPTRSELFPDNWAYVPPDLLIAMNATQGGPVQAILATTPLDPAVVSSLRLTRLETLGAIGFVRGSIAEVQSSLVLLALVIAVVIGLLVYAAMSLEVHPRAREIATLRSLGASPATVAGDAPRLRSVAISRARGWTSRLIAAYTSKPMTTAITRASSTSEDWTSAMLPRTNPIAPSVSSRVSRRDDTTAGSSGVVARIA